MIPTVVADQVTHLISLGLSDDWRFEDEFVEWTGAELTVFDHTVTPEFWTKRRLSRIGVAARPGRSLPAVRSQATFGSYRRFFVEPRRQHVLTRISYDSPTTSSIGTVLGDLDLDLDDRVFLKCDIEGDEWRTIHDVALRPNQVLGMAVEFHNVDLHLERLEDLVTRVLTDYVVVFVNANNFAAVSPNGIPVALELTLVRRDLIGEVTAAQPKSGYFANDPRLPPIAIQYT